MMKSCVILNGQIINIGEWYYQIQSVIISPAELDTEGNVITEAVYEDQITNPLPVGATSEQRDIVESPDGGLIEVGTYVDADVELATAITNATTLEELKKALLGNNGNIARVKGKMK